MGFGGRVTASLPIIRCWFGAVGRALGIEETLQNQYSSDLVDDLAMPGEGAAGGVQMAVRFGGGEALVPEVNGECKLGAEGAGEGLGLGGLGAEIAGHVKGIAEDDGGAAEFAEKAAQGLQVLLRIPADERQQGLGGEAEFVRDGDADAAIAEIEAEKAGFHKSRIADRGERVAGGAWSGGAESASELDDSG